jgi:hypothetical protein
MIFHDFPIILGPQNRGYLPASQGLKSSACLHRRDCKTSTCKAQGIHGWGWYPHFDEFQPSFFVDNNIRSYNYMMSLNILKWGFLLEIIIVWEVIWISNGCFFLQWQLVPFHPWQWYFRDWGQRPCGKFFPSNNPMNGHEVSISHTSGH